MRLVPVRDLHHANLHPVGKFPSSSTDAQPPASFPRASAASQPLMTKTFRASDAPALLALNAHHFSQHPKFAAAFGDLTRELHFSDLGDTARAAFIWEAVSALRSQGQTGASEYCRRATSQLQRPHHRRPVADAVRNTTTYTQPIDDPVSDDDVAALNDRHKWSV